MSKTKHPNITENEKNAYMNALANELSALRAKAGISQNELSAVIGISRQTYGNIERKRQKMQWNTFLALILFFDYNKKTSEMLRLSPAFPTDFLNCINPDSSAAGLASNSFSNIFSEKIIDMLDEKALHTIKTVVMLEYARCNNMPPEEIIKAFDSFSQNKYFLSMILGKQ